MKKIHRVIALISSIIFSSLLFIGCGEKKIDRNNTLVVWANILDSDVEKFQAIADKWSEKNNMDVVIYATTATGTDFIETNERQRPDIFFGVSADDTGRLVKAKAIDEVKEEFTLEDKYVSKDLIQATSIEGVQYGVPLTQETVALYYNKDLVNEVPDTMEELVEVSKTKGMSFEANNYFFSYGIVASQGGYIYKNNDGIFDYKDIGTDTEESIKGFEYLQNLFTKENLFLAGTTDMMASGNFEANKIAFYIGEAGRVRSFTNAGMNFGVSKIPSINGKDVTPFKYVKMATISSNSDKKELAWDLLSTFTEKSDELFMESGPYAPVYKSSLESKIFKENENIQALYDQCNTSMLLPNIIENEAIDYVVNGYLNKLIMGEITPEECGKEMKKDIQDTIVDVFTYED